MKTKKLILIILISINLTGCYDYKELNTISIIDAAEVSKKENIFTVTTSTINPESPAQTTTPQSPFIINKGSGKTIHEAYRNISTKTSRFLYSNHTEILIINESIAKNNIKEILDFNTRYPTIRSEFYVLVGKKENMLEMVTQVEKYSANKIKGILETNANYLGTTTKITFNDFLNMSENPNIEIVLPVVDIINNQEESKNTENTKNTKTDTYYDISKLAIFKGNEFLGYLSNDETIAYNFVKNNIKNTLLTYECEPNKYITYEVMNNKTKINIKNNNININFKINGNINESHCNINLDNINDLNKLKKDFEDKINKEIKNNIDNIIKKYNSDIFGFKDIIYKTNYKEYKKIKDIYYENIYKNLNIIINTKINIDNKGNNTEEINEKNR